MRKPSLKAAGPKIPWDQRKYHREYMQRYRESAKHQKWREQNREHICAQRRAQYKRSGFAYYLKRSYGINEADYEKLLVAQGGRCAVCQTDNPPTAKLKNGTIRWHVDHDHKTNKVRGLLCYKCNVGLGNFEDDTERLKAAIVYLEGHQIPELKVVRCL